MNHDVHSPIFIRAKSTNDKPQTAKPASSIDWRRIIELTLLLSLVVAAVYFIAKLVTPQVVSVMGFLVLRFVVKTILQITFTILGYLFWLAILAAILICIF